MVWDDMTKLPWGVLILFGGGLAIAKGFTTSGLSDYIASQLEVWLGDASPFVIVVSTVGIITGLTELASNTATISLSLPIMASLSQAIEAHPFLLLIPTTVAASCAFMLPVSTPPNAIVFGSGRIPIMKMVIAGIWLDILSIFLLTGFVYTLGHISFGLMDGFPQWATRRFPPGITRTTGSISKAIWCCTRCSRSDRLSVACLTRISNACSSN